MARVRVGLAIATACACGVLMAGCGSGSGNSTPPPTDYTLTIDSSNPTSGVVVGMTENGSTVSQQETTPATVTMVSGTTFVLTAPSTAGSNTFSSWTGCTSASGMNCSVTLDGNTTVTANYVTPTNYVLTVDSVNPSSGVAISVLYPPSTNGPGGTTPFTSTNAAGTMLQLTAPLTAGSNNFTSWTGCTSAVSNVCSVTLNANMTVTVNYAATPTVTVAPASPSINTEQSLAVTVTVAGPSGGPTLTGSVTLTSGTYTSAATTLAGSSGSGTATITIPAGSLAVGSNTLTATYTPDTQGAAYYTPAMGMHDVTVATITPTVTVTPTSTTIDNQQSDSVTVTVSAPGGDPTPTGSVTLAGDGYTGASTALTAGSATFTIPAGTLSAGSDTLMADYTPDTAGAKIYGPATGTSGTITVTAVTTVTVDQTSAGPAVTDQILGMNLAAWYDVVTNASPITTAFGQAGIQAIRWPGGSWSDGYHWGYQPGNSGTLVPPYNCTCSTTTSCTANSEAWAGYSTFSAFASAIPMAGPYDLALTADYGTNEACTGGGDPNEAAAWVAAALKDGVTVSHMTVGNEEYGSWETDLHAKANDPTTYANAVIGTSGYYKLIKAGSPSTLVGIDVDADNATGGWDHTVMANSKGSYDFVEYHYYPEAPGSESDQYLVYDAAPGLTSEINTIKQELQTYGTPDTPIYVGELGSVYTNPGKQSWSITQGLYAGQVLGEAMNDGVSRLTWWIGFGNCNGDNGNDSSSLYGWQDFGAYNVFADGSGDTGGADNSPCNYGGPIGTMSPTARAFQLFSNVAVNGENVLTATVSGGDTTDVRAYAATHSGGTALVLFNLNETTAEPVQITISDPSQTSTTDMQVITYDKAIYDETNAVTPVWAAPATMDLGAQTLPYTLTLQPWSMNVVMIK